MSNPPLFWTLCRSLDYILLFQVCLKKAHFSEPLGYSDTIAPAPEIDSYPDSIPSWPPGHHSWALTLLTSPSFISSSLPGFSVMLLCSHHPNLLSAFSFLQVFSVWVLVSGMLFPLSFAQLTPTWSSDIHFTRPPSEMPSQTWLTNYKTRIFTACHTMGNCVYVLFLKCQSRSLGGKSTLCIIIYAEPNLYQVLNKFIWPDECQNNVIHKGSWLQKSSWPRAATNKSASCN